MPKVVLGKQLRALIRWALCETRQEWTRLNLTGILMLDGVVDTPGRIVIMTTNHPEMLDQP
jgi:hypothetical protein